MTSPRFPAHGLCFHTKPAGDDDLDVSVLCALPRDHRDNMHRNCTHPHPDDHFDVGCFEWRAPTTDTDNPTMGFTTYQVMDLAGVTYRQLDYWARTGLLTPSIRGADGSGSKRLYSTVDVIDAYIYVQLRILEIRPKPLSPPQTTTELVDDLISDLQTLQFTATVLQEEITDSHAQATR